RHYEVCKYYSLDEHTVLPDVLLASTHLWDRLSDQEQRWLREAANNSVPYQRELWKQSEEEALAAVEAAGVTVIRPDKSQFAEKTKSVLESYKDDAQIYPLIKQIQA